MSSDELPPFPRELRAPERFAPAPPRLEDYGDLEAILAAAESEGVLDLPAEDPEAARRGHANRVRDPVIAERLWLLGYLQDVGDAAPDAGTARRQRYLAAVAEFQADAGLVADEWVGHRTWQALQELVTFEEPTRVARHWADGEPRRALVRALRLRLWALGLLTQRPRGASATTVPHEALERFWVLCRRFGLAGFEDERPALARLIPRLFDQDAILEAIAGAARQVNVHGRERLVFSYLKRTDERRRDTDPEVERFLSCVARIELWLLGFDVDIASARNYPVFQFHGDRPSRNRKLRTELNKFWSLLDGGTGAGDRAAFRDRRRLVDYITPELFQVLGEPERVRALAPAGSDDARLQPVDTADYSRQAAEAIDTEEQVNEGWSWGRRLGMRLWDGLKRLWRWLRSGVRTILEVGGNLLRGFFRYSLKAFQIVRHAVRSMDHGLGQYLKGEIETDTGVQVLLAKDGDVHVTLPADAAGATLVSSAERLRYFGAALRLSARILVLLLRAVRATVTGLAGWARFLWSLVHGYREIRPLYLALIRLQPVSRG